MSESAALLAFSLLFGTLQVIAIAVLYAIWGEVKGLRNRLHKVENWMAARTSVDEVQRFFGERK